MSAYALSYQVSLDTLLDSVILLIRELTSETSLIISLTSGETTEEVSGTMLSTSLTISLTTPPLEEVTPDELIFPSDISPQETAEKARASTDNRTAKIFVVFISCDHSFYNFFILMGNPSCLVCPYENK